ncbi:hypothetical protein [Streptomyces sp. NPDC088748]|uniref:hypothetical protein n=1 Tax=Streptomyces sp. NPDC088748 TaxID=3365887 RepID=UPI0037FFEB47
MEEVGEHLVEAGRFGGGSYAPATAAAACPVSAAACESASSMCRAEFEGVSSKTSTIRYRPAGPWRLPSFARRTFTAASSTESAVARFVTSEAPGCSGSVHLARTR